MNPFAKWSASEVSAHNERVVQQRIKKTAPIGLVAEAREKEQLKKTQRLDRRPQTTAKGSHLEERFLSLWMAVGGPVLQRELRFHETRKWRFDFSHLDSRVAFEIEGGVWGGRHTRGGGFYADTEKYLEAFLQGWSVVRITDKQLTDSCITRLVGACLEKSNKIKG